MSGPERAVVDLVNDLRARHDLAPLRPDRRLAKAADAHTRDMLDADFFAHTSSDGTSSADRVLGFRPAGSVGETIGMTPAGTSASSRAIVDGWIASPLHLQVLTHTAFGRIGVSKRTGTIDGATTTVWTADVSSRR